MRRGVLGRAFGSRRVVPEAPRAEERRRHVGVSFARSAGKGGQNVNKVATKVELRVPLASSWLPAPLAARLRLTQRGRVNRDDELLVVSQRHRTQKDNLKGAPATARWLMMTLIFLFFSAFPADAFFKLQQMIDDANELPEERIATDVPEWSKKARIEEKRAQSRKKSLRKSPIRFD